MSGSLGIFQSGLKETGLLSDAGHFGTVYEGQHPIHKKVAIKILKQQSNEDDAKFAARQVYLLYEGLKLKAAEHRNVVRVLDVLQSSSGQIVMVTEFCEGGSVEAESAGNPMGLARVRKILLDAAMGIEALHSLNMIHRDIKPGNILIAKNGSARIADFGFVTDPLLAGIGGPNAYFDHAAPECFNADGSPGIGTVKTDIWAFGLTAYRMLHSELDWKGLGNVWSITRAGRLFASLPWLPHIPDEWRNFIKRCLMPKPSSRYETFADVIAALERLPIEPDWICQSSLLGVKWTRYLGPRIHEVVWDRASADSQKWNATNRPKSGQGQSRSLGSSGGYVSRDEAETGLKDFFQRLRT